MTKPDADIILSLPPSSGLDVEGTRHIFSVVGLTGLHKEFSIGLWKAIPEYLVYGELKVGCRL